MFNKTFQYVKRIFYILLFLSVFYSCDEEIKPINFETSSIDKTFEADITVMFDKATGNNDIGENINSNIEKSIISTLSTSEGNSDLKSTLEGFNNEYLTFKKEFPDATEPVWVLNIETEKSYQSQDVITIAISTYEFKGGAHGNDKIRFLNLDAKTGSILSRNDILKNINEFETLAKEYFMKSMETQDKDLKMEDFFFGKPFQLPENIGYSEDGIVLLYNVYEVASYDQGYTEFVIPFEDAEPYLKLH